jgi:hypothetical protein
MEADEEAVGRGKREKMLWVGGEEHVNKTVGGASDSSLATHGRHNKADAQKSDREPASPWGRCAIMGKHQGA